MKMALSKDEISFIDASRNGELERIKSLIRRKKVSLTRHDKMKDENDGDTKGFTPLMLASLNGRLEVVAFLIGKDGVSVDGKGTHDYTSLHVASCNGHVDVIRCLINNGANIDGLERCGYTPLHLASAWNQPNSVNILLRKGANPYIKDKEKMTALDWAEKKGCTDIVAILKPHQRQPQTTNYQNRQNPMQSSQNNQQNESNIFNSTKTTTTQPSHSDESDPAIQSSRGLLQNAIDYSESSTDNNQIATLSPQYIRQCTQNLAESNLLGGGTYGKVFLGTDSKLSTPRFAVKVIDLSKIANYEERLIRCFRVEATTLKRFKHPNIIALYGTSTLSSSKLALVMEYANKGSLASFLTDDANRARLTVDIRISIMFQLARSIHFLHTGGQDGLKVCHRDIKPDNICLTDDYQVKLIDCGLAKLMQDENAKASGSLKGLFTSGRGGPAGTRGYRCPSYESTNKCVEGSDVFSLGVVYAELIIGCLQGGQAERNGREFGLMYGTYVWEINKPVVDGDVKLAQDADEAIEWNPNILKSISEITIQCMASTPEQRKKTLDLVNELEQILAQALVEKTTTTNRATEPYQGAGADVKPCWLCNRNIATNLRCSKGHAFCQTCACELVDKQVSKGSSSSCRCSVRGCSESEPLSDKDFYGILPFESYQNYQIQKRHNEVFSKMNSMHRDVKRNQDLLRRITNQLTRSVKALAALTVQGTKDCPRLVWMFPTEVSFLTDPIKWFQQKTYRQSYQVAFICQHSGEVAHEPFEITVPRQWVAKVAPLLKYGLIVLKMVAVLPAGTVNVSIPNIDVKKIEGMEKILEKFITEDEIKGIEALTEQKGNDDGSTINLLGEAFELIQEKANEAENLKLWTGRMVPVPLRDSDSSSEKNVKWVMKGYEEFYY